jgi:tRNA1Val (adenine37-N6)-methyltransferase
MSPDIQRAIARNTVSLPFNDLVSGAARLLEDKGLFSVIVPTSASYSVIVCAAQNELFLCRRTDVRDMFSTPVKRTLLEFVKGQLYETKRNDLILHDCNGNNTQEYSNLISSYYLGDS